MFLNRLRLSAPLFRQNMLLVNVQPIVNQQMAHFSTASASGQGELVSFKVTTKEDKTDTDYLKEKLQNWGIWDNEVPACYFPNKDVVEPNPTWVAKKLNIQYSSYKLAACACVIQKMHLYDALAMIDKVDKKGGPVVRKCLEAARANGAKMGYAEDRMFVSKVIIGKALGPKMLDIKGRGKMGIIRAPKCSITIWLEEMGPADFFKLVMKGKAPPAVGHVFRNILYQNDATFEQVKAFTHMTTSAGRYYRQTQFKRLIQLMKKEYQRKGYSISDSKLERNLLEKASREYLLQKQADKETELLSTRATRQVHFEKNYKKK